eukprot:scaffold5248_cov123-Isochrysis_galbana.AAC.4
MQELLRWAFLAFDSRGMEPSRVGVPAWWGWVGAWRSGEGMEGVGEGRARVDRLGGEARFGVGVKLTDSDWGRSRCIHGVHGELARPAGGAADMRYVLSADVTATRGYERKAWGRRQIARCKVQGCGRGGWSCRRRQRLLWRRAMLSFAAVELWARGSGGRRQAAVRQ